MEIVRITGIFMIKVTSGIIGIGHGSRNSYFEITNFDNTYQLVAAAEFEQRLGVQVLVDKHSSTARDFL